MEKEYKHRLTLTLDVFKLFNFYPKYTSGSD